MSTSETGPYKPIWLIFLQSFLALILLIISIPVAIIVGIYWVLLGLVFRTPFLAEKGLEFAGAGVARPYELFMVTLGVGCSLTWAALKRFWKRMSRKSSPKESSDDSSGEQEQ